MARLNEEQLAELRELIDGIPERFPIAPDFPQPGQRSGRPGTVGTLPKSTTYPVPRGPGARNPPSVGGSTPVDVAAATAPRRTPVNFHFTSEIPGGVAGSDVRVYGPVPNPFTIREVQLHPVANAAQGQFVDVLVSDDGDPGDLAAPTGISIFPLLQGLSDLPTLDQQRGLAVPSGNLDIAMAYTVGAANKSIKVRSFFVAPAVVLPDLHVIIVLEEITAAALPPLPPGAAPVPGAPAPAAGPLNWEVFGFDVSGFGFPVSVPEPNRFATEAEAMARRDSLQNDPKKPTFNSYAWRQIG